MFRLSDGFEAPVEIDLDDSGTHNFEVKFRHIDQDELRELIHYYGTHPNWWQIFRAWICRVFLGQKNKRYNKTDADLCRSMVVGWKDVNDDNGPAPFSPEALEVLIKNYRVSRAIARSYMDSAFGARRKN